MINLDCELRGTTCHVSSETIRMYAEEFQD